MGNSKKEIIIQFLKFNIIGVINIILSLGVYSLVTYLTGMYLAGLIGDYTFGILFGFFANKRYTFAKSEQATSILLLKYVLLYVFIFFINYWLLQICIETYGWNQYISQVIVFGCISVGIFSMQKLYVFGDRHAE